MGDHITTTAFRYVDLGEYACEASDLGLAPGQWPDSILAHIEGKGEFLLVRGRVVRDQELEIQYVEYNADKSRFNMGFRVWND